jgi:hypothetical protein
VNTEKIGIRPTPEPRNYVFGAAAIWQMAVGITAFFAGAFIDLDDYTSKSNGIRHTISSALFTPTWAMFLVSTLILLLVCKAWCARSSDGKLELPDNKPPIRLVVRVLSAFFSVTFGWLVGAAIATLLVSHRLIT